MVLAELCRMFPDADIYTHAAIPEKLDHAISEHVIHESPIAKLPFGRRHCQKYLPLMPWAVRQWDLSDHDLIISSESGPVKGIRKPAGAKHICYCHTPMRYLWDMYDFYYRNTGLCGKLAMSLWKERLRELDLRSADSVDHFIANSYFVKERIRRIYQRESTVIHPPVDTGFFAAAPERERIHYLFAGQLVCYKRPDLVIKAFAQLQNEKLIVVGSGPMKNKLQKAATENVSFVTCDEREKLRELYASAKALIFPGIEDFGIIPVEAQAAGCPVIAMNTGGTAETVLNGITGVLMEEQTEFALMRGIETAKAYHWDHEMLKNHASQFSCSAFREKIDTFIREHT